jgi:hypothetical protein
MTVCPSVFAPKSSENSKANPINSVKIDTRWATSNADSIRKHAAELAALSKART